MPSRRSQRFLLAAGALFIAGAIVYLALRHLDLDRIRGALRAVRPLPWLAFAVASYLAGHLVRGERCRRLVERDASLSVPTASNIVVVGYAGNNIFPARLGELVRAGMLAERTGIPLAQAFTVTFVERLLDGMAILSLLVVASAGSVLPGWLARLEQVAALVLGAAVLGVLAAMYLTDLFRTIGSRAAMRLGPAWQARVLRTITAVGSGVAALKRPRAALGLGVLSILVWLLEAGMFFFVLPAFGLPADPRIAIVVMGATNLGILGPSTPGFVGPFHFFCAQTLMLFGVGEALSVTYAFVVHLCFFIPVTIWGAGAMVWYGVQVGATAAAARAARSASHTALVEGVPVRVLAELETLHTAESPSPIFVALAEVLVPSGRSGEGGAARGETAGDRAVIVKVADFMQRQIEALPTRLRWMFGAGMVTFRCWVRARHFHSVCGLPAATRRAVVESWADGGIPLLRQFFRPLRSTALLAYYDALSEAREEGTHARRRVPVLTPVAKDA